MENALTVQPQDVPAVKQHLTVNEVIAFTNFVQDVVKAVMKKDIHYGVIPGTPKPSLYKAGAEKLGVSFRFSPDFIVSPPTDLGRGHREYQVVCRITSILTGEFIGAGVGSCNTMEGKYRYRQGPKELTGRPVPKEYWDNWKTDFGKAQKAIGGKGFGVSKNPDTGKWEIAKVGEKVEHDNPADYYNTVLKMAKKRAYVDAVITCTAASDVVTQDLEDMPKDDDAEPPEEPDKNPPLDWEASLYACKTVEELQAIWKKIPPDEHKKYASIKDKMKEALTMEET